MAKAENVFKRRLAPPDPLFCLLLKMGKLVDMLFILIHVWLYNDDFHPKFSPNGLQAFFAALLPGISEMPGNRTNYRATINGLAFMPRSVRTTRWYSPAGSPLASKPAWTVSKTSVDLLCNTNWPLASKA